MTHPIQILYCTTPRQLALFERTYLTLWSNESNFAPPPPSSLTPFLHPSGHFHKTHGSIHPFLALRNNSPVASLAAILNYSHNAYYNDRTAFFGFLSSQNDPPALTQLFDHVFHFIRKTFPASSLRGPFNPSINDDCGILTDGFDQPPTFGIPFNPPFLPNLLTQLGFRPLRSLLSFRFNLNQPLPNRIQRIHTRLVARKSFTLRSIRLRFLPSELERIAYLYNITLNRNSDFVPITYSDLLQSASFFRLAAQPALIQFLEDKGTPAAFAISLPNYAEVFARTKNLPYPLRLPATLLLLKFHRFRSARFIILGIAPNYRDRALTAWLFTEQYRAATQHHYQWAELAWIEENNHEVIQNALSFSASINKKITLYEKSIQ